ncbi:MAG: CoA transferase [Dehalococcoidia bacterium]|nr:CoA transferase [Dehalococcoidia bacterium]
MPQTASRQCLAGIRVADVSLAYAGPTCGRILADMGAEVIKVESLQRADMLTRRLVPAENELKDKYWERSGFFMKRNTNKLGVTLDLRSVDGKELFKKLVRISDVVVENYTPRVMKQFGLDYSVLKDVNPNIIMISLSGYGQDGPYRDRVALGPGLEASCGLASLTGYEGGPPSLSGLSYIDAISGVVGAAAVMTALVYRQRTGKGQYVDLSEQESVMPSFANAIMDFTMNGRTQPRIGNRHRSVAPHGCYRCKGYQAWITIVVTSNDEWMSFCAAMGNPPWVQEQRFATAMSRWHNRDELDRLIEERTVGFDRFELMRELQLRGVAAGVVLSGKDLLFNPHLEQRGFFDVIDHPVVGRRPYPKQFPVKFTEAEAREPKAAPLLGQDNEYLLKDLLGLSDTRIAELDREKIIGTYPAVEQVKPRSWLNLDLLHSVGAIRREKDYLEQLSERFKQRMGSESTESKTEEDSS